MELLLALLPPAILLVGTTLLLAKGKTQLPNLLSRASKNNVLFWNLMVGTSIAVAAIKYISGK